MSARWFASERMVPGLRILWGEEDAPDPDTPPIEVVDWLARLRLLHGVPFAYLVPDDDLLPPESIRFFWLDRDWTDAAVEGALSAAGAYSMVRTVAATEDRRTRSTLDERERNVSPHVDLPEGVERLPSGGPVTRDAHHVGHLPYNTLEGGQQVVTGFLLRSRAVSGWPGLHVRALRGDEELRLLRVERLAAAVLLVLVDGCPDEVHVEEPRRGLQFGVDVAPGPGGQDPADDDPRGGRRVILRDPTDGTEIDPPGPARRATVDVPFRRGAPGVVDMAALAERIGAAPDAPDFTADDDGEDWPAGVSSAELTTQLLQFPYRQRFSGDGEDPDGGVAGVVLVVTTPLVVLEEIARVADLE